MSSEGFIITNPKGNNRDLFVQFLSRSGEFKKLATIRPGQRLKCEKSKVTISEVERPRRLLATQDGSVVLDRKR